MCSSRAARWAVCLCGVVLTTSALGCGGLQAETSGQIGCAQEDIKITDKRAGWATDTWTAECHGKKFFCSSVTTSNNVQTGSHTVQVNCTPAVEGEQPKDQAGGTPAAAAGCQFDTQCKGDRVCVKGECVAPASASAPRADGNATCAAPSAAPAASVPAP